MMFVVELLEEREACARWLRKAESYDLRRFEYEERVRFLDDYLNEVEYWRNKSS